MEKSVFIEKIDSFIKKHHLFTSGCRYLATVSGGADSVVMLRTMLNLGIDCEVAHCNFHLRGEESDRDERFVRELCSQLGVKCHVTHFDVDAYEKEHHVSTEMACRELRYKWFRSLVKELKLSGIIVAHHRDDNIETLFLNIMRGSGIAGMTAMRPINGDILRPMLCVTRAEVEQYATEIGQDFITDSTNAENDVKRNRLRNIILPQLREHFPDADAGILRTIENMTQCNAIYKLNIDDIRKSHITTKDSTLTIHLSDFIDRYIASDCAETIVFELIRNFGFYPTQSSDIMTAYLGDNPTGKMFLSSTHEAELSRGNLNITPTTRNDENEWNVNLSAPILVPIKISIERHCSNDFNPKTINGKDTACFSADIQQAKLTLRHWRKGDRFHPFGMKGSRLVSDLFSDAKLSEQEKKSVWLLVADDEIVWILGMRTSSRYKITDNSPEYIQLSIK